MSLSDSDRRCSYVGITNLDAIASAYVSQDHEYALAVERQLAVKHPGITGTLTSHDIMDFNRFCDCCEDGARYDVPKERMKVLRALGLVEGGGFGFYSTTRAGNAVREAWFKPDTNEAAA